MAKNLKRKNNIDTPAEAPFLKKTRFNADNSQTSTFEDQTHQEKGIIRFNEREQEGRVDSDSSLRRLILEISGQNENLTSKTWELYERILRGFGRRVILEQVYRKVQSSDALW